MSNLSELQENIREARTIKLRFGHYITEKGNILLVLNGQYSFLMPNFEKANEFLKERIIIQKNLIENNKKRQNSDN